MDVSIESDSQDEQSSEFREDSEFSSDSGGFRGVRWGDRTPLRENFFDFSQQKRTKNKFILLQMHLKMCFWL